ncbi:Cyclin-dependent kinase inhibitor 5 [Zea mays]|uniref:Cyclin-dependent kinase inhibitor 5 n=1 Tax=Zea mays TaxID=4577 RepID=A0A1D6GPN3_MAIZE|nr:Cyclin-dependent kinase inhibitor 5 [Zea mays]
MEEHFKIRKLRHSFAQYHELVCNFCRSYLSFTSGPLPCLNRNTRETTPCSLINSEMISTPGSTTRSSHSSHRRVKAPPVHAIPSSTEMNEYFAAEQRRQQQAFIDKYNFDPVNDCPLPGRFEWVKLD